MRLLAGFLPFMTLVVLWVGLSRRTGSWRTSALTAATVWGVLLTALTEGLSLLRALSFGVMLMAWVISLAVVALIVLRGPGRGGPGIRPAPPRRWVLALSAVVAIAAVTGFIALAAPPNTSDSMVYHMSRVMHWIQNRSVEHYPTHIERQLYLAPWAEFTILHLQILSGGDRLANLVQWLAMLGSLVAVSLIARQLGGDARCQILSAIVCATIPMGILQSSSTQTDYVATFWLVCFAHRTVGYLAAEDGPGDAGRAWWIGCSLGLAILTKATAYIVAAPFLAWMILEAGWCRRARLAQTIAIIGLAVVALNAGHVARNVQIYGSPLGPGSEGGRGYANERFDVATLATNAVRNLAIHAGTPSESVNGALERGIAWFHRQIGVELNDPRTTWPEMPFQVRGFTTHEDFAGNLVHVVAIASSIAIVLVTRALRRRAHLLGYLSVLVVGALLFALYLKWQPWHSRLHVPFFVLWSPLIAVVWGAWATLAGVLTGVLLVVAAPALVGNESRPLLGPDSVLSRSRMAQYFHNRPDLRAPYTAAMQHLAAAGCSNVGLWVDGPVYQLWVLGSREFHVAPPRIEHLGVGNASARATGAGRPPCHPCALLVVAPHHDVPATFTLDGLAYRESWRAPPVTILVRQE
jgi:hypothetical protein